MESVLEWVCMCVTLSFIPLKGDSLVWKVNRLPSLVGVRKRNELSSILRPYILCPYCDDNRTFTLTSLTSPVHRNRNYYVSRRMETLDRFQMKDQKSDVPVKFQTLPEVRKSYDAQRSKQREISQVRNQRETVIAGGWFHAFKRRKKK